jgi:hypothetical protein
MLMCEAITVVLAVNGGARSACMLFGFPIADCTRAVAGGGPGAVERELFGPIPARDDFLLSGQLDLILLLAGSGRRSRGWK